MPPETTWSQYPIIAIIFLATSAIAYGFYRFWKELIGWFEIQDAKREAERKAQRDWQAEQDKVRDLRWQDFLKSMQDEWIEQEGRNTEVLKQLSAKVDLLILAVNQHDTWARAKDRT